MTIHQFCGAEIFMFARTNRLTAVQGLRLNSDASSGGCEDVDTLRVSRRKKAPSPFPLRGPQGGRVIALRRSVF